MGPAFYIMAILGCADSETACQQVRLAETQYATEAACNSATSAILYENSDIAFPVVMAQCRPANRSMAAAQDKPRG
jgi:ABC-type proline/glycine betaine transport system substrate-binding protein